LSDYYDYNKKIQNKFTQTRQDKKRTNNTVALPDLRMHVDSATTLEIVKSYI